MMKEFKSLKELLAFNIKYYRYLNGISQEYLAELCNLTAKYITDIECGRHCPTMDNIESLAKALNIEPYVLLMNVQRSKDIITKMQKARQYNQKI